mgnify:CR=1 FL=1
MFLLTIYKEKTIEMNKKQVIRINENQLKQIVAESVKLVLNEGYGTPPKNDLEMFDKIEFSEHEPIKSIRQNISNLLNVIHKSSKNKYINKIRDLCVTINRILELWEKQEIQKTGLQPDIRYDSKHGIKNKNRKIEDNEPIWHGYEDEY